MVTWGKFQEKANKGGKDLKREGRRQERSKKDRKKKREKEKGREKVLVVQSCLTPL